MTFFFTFYTHCVTVTWLHERNHNSNTFKVIFCLPSSHASPLMPTSQEHPYGSGRQKRLPWHCSGLSLLLLHRYSQSFPNLFPLLLGLQALQQYYMFNAHAWQTFYYRLWILARSSVWAGYEMFQDNWHKWHQSVFAINYKSCCDFFFIIEKGSLRIG